jgi:hypothetical protein
MLIEALADEYVVKLDWKFAISGIYTDDIFDIDCENLEIQFEKIEKGLDTINKDVFLIAIKKSLLIKNSETIKIIE